MPSELRAEPHDAAPSDPPVDRRTRRRAWLLFAAAAWNAWVWLTRLGIVVDQSQTVPFRVVHGVLIVVSLAFAVALAVVGWRMFRESRVGGSDEEARR